MLNRQKYEYGRQGKVVLLFMLLKGTFWYEIAKGSAYS